MFDLKLDISGVPGIGKTVSVLEVIKQLKNEYEDKEVFYPSFSTINLFQLDFNFIHVNGLGLPNPENAYQTILQGIVDIKDTTNSSACVILSKFYLYFFFNREIQIIYSKREPYQKHLSNIKII